MEKVVNLSSINYDASDILLSPRRYGDRQREEVGMVYVQLQWRFNFNTIRSIY